jgi:hypothetical protein
MSPTPSFPPQPEVPAVIYFACPHCQKKLRTDANVAQQRHRWRARCPQCKASIDVPKTIGALSPTAEGARVVEDWAGDDEARRKRLLPLLRKGLDDNICQLKCVQIAGTFGALAKVLKNQLENLKLTSRREEVRDAARDALEMIDRDS